MEKLLIRTLALVAPLVLFTAAAAQQLPQVSISGRTTVTIRDGDFVYPALSPDGNRIAYSSVVIANVCSKADPNACDRTELTEIFVRDLRNGKTKRVLSAKQSEAYMAYSAFVVELVWLDPHRIRATIADGDVDTTELIIKVDRGRIEKESFSGQDELEEKTSKLIRRAFPSATKEWLSSVINSEPPVEWPGRGSLFLLHKQDWTLADSDWSRYLTLITPGGRAERLLPEPIAKDFNLAGGVQWGIRFVAALSDRTTTELIVFDGGKPMTRHKLEEGYYLHPIAVRPRWLVFSLSMDSKATANTLYALDQKGRLYRVAEQAVQASASAHSDWIALVVWDGKNRHIEVRALKLGSAAK